MRTRWYLRDGTLWEMEWEPRIDVSNSDILAAKSAWFAAQGSDAPPQRVDELRRG